MIDFTVANPQPTADHSSFARSFRNSSLGDFKGISCVELFVCGSVPARRARARTEGHAPPRPAPISSASAAFASTCGLGTHGSRNRDPLVNRCFASAFRMAPAKNLRDRSVSWR